MAFYFPEGYGVKDTYVNSLIEYNELLSTDLEEPSETVQNKLEKVHAYFSSLSKPRIYHPYDKNNYIKINDAIFETTCFLLEERGVNNPAEISIHSFISRVNRIKKETLKHGNKM